MNRWLRFNAVGVLGAGIQLAALALMLRLRIHYLVATVLAIEVALLHNYLWHRLWTWAGQEGSLWRFHLSNGLISFLSNLLLMRWFAGSLHFPPVPSNLAAIVLTSFLNYFLALKWVFVQFGAARYDGEVRQGR
ncbi:MAG TPA: GtrA family protein [Bryobacteraceae bacterium]|nr:GtrA family protein [Bryobacteraceae bacterium]